MKRSIPETPNLLINARFWALKAEHGKMYRFTLVLQDDIWAG